MGSQSGKVAQQDDDSSWDKISMPRSAVGQNQRSMLPAGIRQSGSLMQAGPGFGVTMAEGSQETGAGALLGGPRAHINALNASGTQTMAPTTEGKSGKLQAFMTNFSGPLGPGKPNGEATQPQGGGLFGKAGEAIGGLFGMGPGVA